MTALKLTLACLCMALAGNITSFAQEMCWRIVDGKGAGFMVSGPSFTVNNPEIGAVGTISFGVHPNCNCEPHAGHYHGTIFGIPDPDPDGCGWGCVDRVPCNVTEAVDNLDEALLELQGVAPQLGQKLIDILVDGIEKLPKECYSVLLGQANAMGQEIHGARANQQLTDEQIDNLLDAFMSWVNQAMDSMVNLPAPTNNTPANTNEPCCKISIVKRSGSGAQTTFRDVKAKLNADVGEVVALDVDKCPQDGVVTWQYDFKAAAPGDVEPGTGISFSDKRFCVIAERATTVKVTATLRCPNGKTAKDTVTIVYK